MEEKIYDLSSNNPTLGDSTRFKRTKKEILQDYKAALISKGIFKNKDIPLLTDEFLEELLIKKLYEVEKYKGQDISTLDAFYHWCKFIIYKDLDTGREVWNPFVKQMFLNFERNKYAAILAARGFGKSFMVFGLYLTFKHFLWERYQSLVMVNIPRMGKRNLKVMRDVIDSNEFLFSKVTKSSTEDWVTQNILRYNEGSIEIISLGSTPRSAHVNQIFCDDIQRDDLKYGYDLIENMVLGVLMPTIGRKRGRMVIVGTPANFTDLFHRIMKDKNGKMISNGEISIRNFASFMYPAFKDIEKRELNFPGIYSPSELLLLRESMGEDKFMREYQLECISENTRLFPYEMIEAASDPNEQLMEFGEEGKLYLIACLPDGEKVLTNNGFCNIEDFIKTGKKLLNSSGEYIHIKNYQRNYYKGDIIKITPFPTCKETRFTPNHPILVYDEGNICYKKAGHLNGKELLVYPRIIKSNKFIEVNQEDIRIDRKINPHFLDSFEFGRFVGLWLAEGWTRNCGNHKLKTVHFAFHEKEKEYANFVVDFAKIYLNRSANIIYKGNNAVEVKFNSEWMVKYLSNFGHKALYKNIDLSYNYSDDYLLGLLKGYYEGDGCVIKDKRRNHFQINFTSISYGLLDSIQKIMYRFNIMGSIMCSAKKRQVLIRNRICNCHEKYEIRLSALESNKFLSLFGWQSQNKFIQEHTSRQQIFGNYVLYPIKKLKKVA